MRHAGRTILGFCLGIWPVCAHGAASPSDVEFFESRVRPVLSQHCYQCHSVSAEKIKGGLRLDSRSAVLQGGDDGPAIVPEHPEQSRLVEAIGYSNPDLQMPPKSKLADAEIALLTEWVKRGAPWPDEPEPKAAVPLKSAFDLNQRKASNWAFAPLRSAPPPAVPDPAWSVNPIDAFVFQKLAEKGLSPAPPADKRALIRRAYFDLTGLPPAPAAVEAFVRDDAPDAFARLVDGLLASPHFGERWARHWMDLVRYAETYGHEFDFPIPNAWRYRDYLVRAFNADVPYDRLVAEHVAGDLLPDPRRNPQDGTDESVVGSGFWFLGEQVHAPVDVRQHQADRIDNQIDVFGKTFLGLTLGCARCHDHKFDPISQKDYYSLYGVLESTDAQDAMLDPNGKIDASARRLREAHAAFDAAGRELIAGGAGEQLSRNLLAALDGKAAAGDTGRWSAALKDPAVARPEHPLFAWSALRDKSADEYAHARDQAAARCEQEARRRGESLDRTTLFKSFRDGPGDWTSTGWSFGADSVAGGKWDATAKEPRLLMPGVMNSATLSTRLRGVLRSPSFVLQSPRILYRVAGQGCRIRLIVDGYRMDQFNGLLFGGLILDVNTRGKFAWLEQSGDVGRYLGHRAHIEVIDNGDGWIALDEVRFAPDGVPVPAAAPSDLAAGLLREPANDSPRALAAAYGRRLDSAIEHLRDGKIDADESAFIDWSLEHGFVTPDAPALAKFKEQSARIEQLGREVADPVEVLAAVADREGIDEHVFLRGSPKNLGPVTPRRFLEAISGPTQPGISHGSGRLELSARMTDASDPLLPRVMVNRIWHHLFGRGIVASTDNFGVMGTPPTHPELLDYLAGRFVAEGWSVKKSIRAMMLSRTYQMSSRPADEHAEQEDPSNLLLHRANLRRLEAEPIRDEILAVSGRLNESMFGPPVEVYLTDFMQGRGRPGSGPLDGDGRRSLYTAVRRNFLPPMMLAFDYPTPFSSMGRRTVSNVPAQALTLLNDPFVVEQGRLWAERVLKEPGLSAPQRIGRMYEAAFARPPTDDEVVRSQAFLRQQGETLGIPAEKIDTDPRVWSDLAHALINVKEFVFLG